MEKPNLEDFMSIAYPSKIYWDEYAKSLLDYIEYLENINRQVKNQVDK